MSGITLATIQKVAHLSRISNNKLTAEELERYRSQLEAILEHVTELQAVDTGDIATTDGWRTNTIADLRQDQIDPDDATYERVRQNILKNFPNRNGDFCVVNNIFEEN